MQSKETNSNHSKSAASTITPFLRDIELFFRSRPIIYVDVGSHRGETFDAIFLSKLNLAQAHLIEPNPTSFKKLKANVEKRSIERKVTCHQKALSNQETNLKVTNADSMSRVTANDDVGNADAGTNKDFEVRSTTLDILAELLPDQHISLLKVDVEGHEIQVLEGAGQLLSDQAIDIIYIEAGMNPRGHQQTYHRDIEELLLSKSYKIFKIYEQKNEWIEDSPALRRVNIAYVSQKFADKHSFQFVNELEALLGDNHSLRRALDEKTAEIKALKVENRKMKNQVQERRAKIRELSGLVELVEKRNSTLLSKIADLNARESADKRQASANSTLLHVNQPNGDRSRRTSSHQNTARAASSFAIRCIRRIASKISLSK